jgi:plastocyanin
MGFKRIVGVGAVLALVGGYLVACGGSSGPSMPSPIVTGGGGGGVVTISIVGMNGAQSFSPNPASVPVGQSVRWVNNDSVHTHRIVQDSGAFDTGNLAPGATSSAVTINTAAAMPYHCSIHPSMVGSINGTGSTGGGGGY